MTKVAVVYFSGYGHTKSQAQAVAEGAQRLATVDLFAVDAEGNLPEDAWAGLNAAQAIIFGTPTYMGSVAWQFKKFMDAGSKVWMEQGWKDKIAAGFTNSASMNGDKLNTLQSLFIFAMQHAMQWVGTGMLPANTKAADRNDLNFLGSFSGLMAQSPADASPEEGPLPGDLETARAFGERIARVAARVSVA